MIVTNEPPTAGGSIFACAPPRGTPAGGPPSPPSPPGMTAARPPRPILSPMVNGFTDWRARKMMRTMGRTGERIGRLDIAIAVALSALGVLLMYGNVTDAEVDASWWSIPVFLLVTIPVL